MDKDAYIKQLEDKNATLIKRITMLEKRIEELERRVGINSSNSSKPPSSDPPGTSVALPKRRSKKRGATKGHEPHLRELLPQKFVKNHIHLKPDVCTCGGTNLEETSEESLRHQIVDIGVMPMKPADPGATRKKAGCGHSVAPRQHFLWFMPNVDKKRHANCWVIFLAYW